MGGCVISFAPVRGHLAAGGRGYQPEQPQRCLRVLDVLQLAGLGGLAAGGGRGLGLPLPRPPHTYLGRLLLSQAGGERGAVESPGGAHLLGLQHQAGLHTQHSLSPGGATFPPGRRQPGHQHLPLPPGAR